MSERKPRYDKDEFFRRGREIYERDVKPRLRPEDDNKIVAIDIETGDYEVDSDGYAAGERLVAKRPDAQMWLERVGHRGAFTIRARSKHGGVP